MKTLKTLLPLTCLLLLPLAALATPIAYPFRVTDNSGVLVAGATVSIGVTTLTSGSATVTPAAAGEKLLSTNAAPAATVSVTLLDYGTGDYALVYDPAVNGELYVPLTVSKAGSTITGGAALVAIVASADSSTIVGVNATTTGTNTLATGIKAKTDLVSTNAMDSPNEVTSQGNAGTILTQTTAANQQSNAITGLTTQGYTITRAAKLDNADVATSSRMATFVYTAPPALPGDFLNAGEIAKLAFLDAAISTRSTYAGGAVASVTGAVGSVTAPVALPTAPAGYGGGGSTADTPGTTTLLARLGSPVGATLAADLAAVKSDTGNLVTGVAALPAAVWAYTASDGLTHQQSDALRTAILARGFAVSYNASTRTQITTYFKADNATVIATTTVIYDTTGRAVTRTTAFTNLP